MPPAFQSFDPFQTLTDEQQRVQLQGRRGLIEVSPAAPGVLHVRAGGRRSLTKTDSLALAGPQTPAPAYQLRPSASGARFSQPGLNLQIAFEPLRLTVSRPEARPAAVLT